MDLLMKRDGVDSMDLVFINGETPTTGGYLDALVQRLYIRLRTFFGDWYLNVEYGVPYLERILGHKVKKSTVDAIIQEQIMLERGVKQIMNFKSSLDPISREYVCEFRVKAEGGATSGVIPFTSSI